MYQYNITFWLANDKKKEELDLTDWNDVFYDAEKQYNFVGKTARNPKQILKTEVEKKCIKLQISSQIPLSTPTLALRSYSQFLVNTEFGKRASVDNALFRGSWEVLEREREDVTGPEMIKLLAELLMSGKKADEEIIQNIKSELIVWRNKNEPIL